MVKKFLIVSFILMFTTNFGATAKAQAQLFIIEPNSSGLSYSFLSTLHPVKGVAKKFRGTLLFDESQIESGEVFIDPMSMDSKNKKRDHHMHKMFDVQRYTQIKYQWDRVDLGADMGDDLYRGVLKGKLSIKNVTKDVDVDVVLKKNETGYQLKGTSEVSLKAFELEPPSVLLLIRVFNTIKIQFDVQLVKK